ncbi:DUF308 domain-containing protein [Christensenellaceae bacterium OttesenSCG-928-K19]|nr:DUF308 domain-containing protein [Christensenellaceae bacterium OttesenSCG-928-K19]
MEKKKAISGDTFKLIVNIVILVLGIILIAQPNAAMQAIVIILGIILTAFGAIAVAVFAVKRSKGTDDGSNILTPVICLILGIVLLVFNSFFANILLPLVIAIWMLVIGIMNLVSAGSLKGAGAGSWRVTMIMALGAIVLGIITLVGVFAGGNVVGVLLGVCMLLFGILSIINWAAMQSARSKL